MLLWKTQPQHKNNMSWFLLALIGPILWSIVNHLDKYLLEKYFKEGGVGALMIFSSITGVFVLPFVYLIHSEIWNISLTHKMLMVLVGIAGALALLCYFYALEQDEASVVVVFYQLIPVFGYILSYFLLGEVLNKTQLIAMFLILAGAIIISFEIDEENKFKLRKKTALLMLVSVFLFSLDSVLFKFVAIQENFWISTFWEYVGLGLVGIFLFVFLRSYRNEFLKMIKINKTKILSINITNEVLTIVGNITFAYAYMLAPVALVLLVNAYQPIFVFVIGILITLFLPKRLIAEKIELKHIFQKVAALVIMGAGTYLLFLA